MHIGTNASMNRKWEPFSLDLGIVVTAILGLTLVVAGGLDRKVGRSPAEQPAQAVPRTAAAKTRVRLSAEPPPVKEPYPCLHGGELKGPAVPESPDPLAGYRWREPSADDSLQS
jgi:hypothetical protein